MAIFAHFCQFLSKLELTPPLLASVTWPNLGQIKSTTCWGKFGTQPGPIGAPFLYLAQRVGLVKKWPFLPIFGQTGAYTSPFGQCDMALSCPDQVYYLLGKIWNSTGADRSSFPMAQRVGLVKKWPFLPIFGQTGAYTSPFGRCVMALSCPD